MQKKICLIGGEDVHKRIALSKYLISDGYNVTIIGTTKQPFPDSITYIDYNLVRRFSPISDYKTIQWIKTFFTEHNFDIIHTFDTKPAFLVPIALQKTKTPITRTITGLGTIFMSKTLSNSILKFMYMELHKSVKHRIYKTVFQNEEDRDIYLNNNLISNSNYEFIYSSGIDLENYKSIAKRDNETFTFICVARLVYEKGIVNLLEAAQLCRSKKYNFKVLLVGPLEENSKRLNKKLLDNYNDVVDVLGERNDIENLLLQSDVFILPTFREGFARVLLEAAAVGLPIISTNVPGVREFVRQDHEGILIEPKDSKALANAMIALATNETLRNKFSKNVLNRVKLFTLKNIAGQYISIFNQAIKNNPNQ